MDASLVKTLVGKSPDEAAIALLQEEERKRMAQQAKFAEQEAARLDLLAKTSGPSLAPAAEGINALFGTKLNPKTFDSSLEDLVQQQRAPAAEKASGLEAIAIRNLLSEKKGVGGDSTKPTKGEDQLDKDFAKTYEDFVASGGLATVARNLQGLDLAKKELEKNKNLTGTAVEFIPFESVQTFVKPEATKVKELVEQVVQSSLKATLGTAFTEKEGERVISRAYNPRLPAEENIRRIDAVKQELASIAAAKAAAAKYFEENGTLKGFKGANWQALKEDLTNPSRDFAPEDKPKSSGLDLEALKAEQARRKKK